MKKNLLLLVLFALNINHLCSQVTYFHYLDYSSEWRSYYSGWNGWCCMDSRYTTTYFDGDTIISGNSYYKSYSVVKNVTFSGTTTSLDGPYFVREDNLGRFLVYNTTSASESVSFDNQAIKNSIVGDPFPYPGATCTVQNLSLIPLDTLILKRIYGDITGSHTGSLEGVGVIGLSCAVMIEESSYLCFYTKGIDTLDFDNINYNLFPSPLRTGHITNVSEMKNKLNYSIFPNPSNSIITIDLLDNDLINNKSSFSIKINDVLNNEIFNKPFQEKIDISNMSNGVYFLSLFKDGVIIGNKKILKQ